MMPATELARLQRRIQLLRRLIVIDLAVLLVLVLLAVLAVRST